MSTTKRVAWFMSQSAVELKQFKKRELTEVVEGIVRVIRMNKDRWKAGTLRSAGRCDD